MEYRLAGYLPIAQRICRFGEFRPTAIETNYGPKAAFGTHGNQEGEVGREQFLRTRGKIKETLDTRILRCPKILKADGSADELPYYNGSRRF